MKLLLDIGNTAAKIAIADENGNIVHTEHLSESWSKAIGHILKEHSITRCNLSTVAAEDEMLSEVLHKNHIPTLQLTDTTPCLLKGIPRGYGSDRIAADIGALIQSEGHTVLVIDSGTCITYDLICNNTLLGGVISPGIALRLRSMHEHTARLPMLIPHTDTPLMGTDTQTAMMSAAIHGTRFEAESYIRILAKQYPDLIVFTTGGNTLQLSDSLPVSIIHDTNLIFKGLASL